MAVEGFVDSIQDGKVTGWAFDAAEQQRRQKVVVHIDGGPRETIVADRYRADLLRTKKGDGRCAFVYEIPSDVEPDQVSLAFQSSGQLIPRSQGRTGNNKRREQRLRHPLVHGQPEVTADFSRAEFSIRDIEITERLIEAYAHSMSPTNGDGNGFLNQYGGMWVRISNEYHREAVEMLEARDAPSLARYLHNMHTEWLVHGISQGRPAFQDLLRSQAVRTHVATICWDRLVSLAEALGCLPVEAPEQLGHWGENLYGKVEDVIERIEKHLHIELTAPTVATGLFGIQTSRGVFDPRAIDAVYAAYRIRQLVDRPNGSVCEIGSGLGWVGYYAFLLGIGSYTIVDLPIMNVLQGYNLIKALPQAEISLAGESGGSERSHIRICSTQDFDRLDPGQFSLFFNQDSFPEIGQANLRRYLIAIRDAPGAALLSINQESEGKSTESEKQMIVHRQIEAVGGFCRVCRFPHWLRAGYVEELFRCCENR